MPTLQDVEGWKGRTVVDPEGDKVGTLEEFYLDRQSGDPTWAAIRTGLFGTHTSLAPLDGAALDDDSVRLGYSKSAVKDAPRPEVEGELTRDEERRLFDHYGAAAAPRETTAAATAGTGSASADTGSTSADQASEQELTTPSPPVFGGPERPMGAPEPPPPTPIAPPEPTPTPTPTPEPIPEPAPMAPAAEERPAPEVPPTPDTRETAISTSSQTPQDTSGGNLPAERTASDQGVDRLGEGWLIEGTLIQPRRARLRRYIITEELVLEKDGTESSRIVGKEPYPEDQDSTYEGGRRS